MNKLLLILCLAFALPAFSQEKLTKYKKPKPDSYCKKVQNLTYNDAVIKSKYNTYTKVVFESYNELLADLDRRKGLGYLDEKVYEEAKANLPLGGVLKVETYRDTPESSDMANLSIIIWNASGQEVQKITPPSKQGTKVAATSLVPQYYRNVTKLNLPNPMNFEDLTMNIFDQSINLTFEYILDNK